MNRINNSLTRLYNCCTAARYLGVTPKTVRKWAQTGSLPGIKIGSRGDWRFKEEELRQVIKSPKLNASYSEIPQLVLDTDLKLFRINSAAIKYFDINADKTTGVPFLKVFPYFNDELIVEKITTAREKLIPVKFEHYFVKRQCWIEFEISPHDDKKHLLIIIHDITAKKSEIGNLLINTRIVESISDAVVGIDKAHHIILWSRQAEKIYGWKREEVLGKNAHSVLKTVFNGNDKNKWESTIIKEGIWKGEVIQIRKDHKRLLIHTSSAAVKDKNNNLLGIVAVNRNITDTRKWELSLKQYQKDLEKVNTQLKSDRLLLENILDQMSSGVIIADSLSNRIILANKSAEKIWRKRIKEGSDLRDFHKFERFHLEGTPYKFSESPLARALEKGEIIKAEELLFKRGDGSMGVMGVSATPIKSKGRIVAGVVVFSDITERQQLEQSIKDSERRFRELADAMPQLVWTANPDGVVDYYNKRFREYEGIKINGERWEWTPVLYKDDRIKTVVAWKKAVAAATVYQVEHRIKMTGGDYRWHLSRGIPVINSNGKVEKWFGTATDIHERKLFEEGLVEQNRKKDEFIGIASHELKTPITSMKTYLQFQKRKLEKEQDNENLYFITKVNDQVERIQKLVEDLLDVSRIKMGRLSFNKTTVNLDELIKKIIVDFQLSQDSHAVQKIGRIESLIECDPGRINQVLSNLLNNAVKYSPKSNKIVVKVGEESGFAKVSIRDFGFGIPNSEQDKIFERFYRFEQKKGTAGFGIGLYIAKDIIENHGGNIWVESKIHKGSIFNFTLPLKTAKKT